MVLQLKNKIKDITPINQLIHQELDFDDSRSLLTQDIL